MKPNTPESSSYISDHELRVNTSILVFLALIAGIIAFAPDASNQLATSINEILNELPPNQELISREVMLGMLAAIATPAALLEVKAIQDRL